MGALAIGTTVPGFSPNKFGRIVYVAMGSVNLFTSSPPPPPRICRVCQVPIPETARFRFCDTCRLEHEEQTKERQREGVSTSDLDTWWHDRLTDWRERPAILDGEAHPELFRLGIRVGSWLVFSRGYLAEHPYLNPRLPDWIAVNITTDEVRRFVDIDQVDVWDDLEGIRPAPGQESLVQRWGKPEARPPRKAYGEDGSGTHRVSAMIQDALIPVYGVFGNPLGVRLRGTSQGASGGHGPIQVSLRFASGDVLAPGIVVSLSSERANNRRISHSPGYGSGPNPDLALALLRESKRDLWEHVMSVSPQTLSRHIVVPGFEPATELLYWPEPVNLFNFALKNEESILILSAQGLSETEFFHLVSQVDTVNGHPQLLAQYGIEVDEVRRAMLDRRGGGAGGPDAK